MVLTNRQLKLVQAGAIILQDNLMITIDKAISIISAAMTAENEVHNIEMEDIDAMEPAFRKKFIRGVVIRITRDLRKNTGISETRVKKAIDAFITIIEETWDS